MLPSQVDIYTAKNPFEGTRVHDYAVEGQTIQEIIVDRNLYGHTAYGVVAVINGTVVPESMYERVKPKTGSEVILRVVPRGRTGKIIFSVILSIVTLGVGAVAAYGVGLAGLFTSMQGFAAMGAIAGGLMGIASGIQNLVAPPPQVPFSGAIPQSQDSAALNGTKNSARLYGPVRTVLGRYRVYPDLLGKPFGERVGKDSILRLLMCFGYGPLHVDESTIKIGETPIQQLGARYKVHEGWDDDGELEIFRDEVDSDSTLQPSFPRINDDWPEGSSRRPITEAVLQSKPGAKELSIDIQFIKGLIAFDERGAPIEVEVQFYIQHKGANSNTWSDIPAPTMGVDVEESTGDTGCLATTTGDVDPNSSLTHNGFKFTLSERGLVTRGIRWDAPSGLADDEAVDVRIVRVATTTEVTKEDRIFSDARVVVLRTIKPHIESNIKNLAKIEIEINAAETGLSNVVDNLSAICTSYAPKWDSLTKSWGPATTTSANAEVTMFKTRNAAWLFAQVLRGPANSRPTPDSRIDGASIAEWAGNLDGTGLVAISGTVGQPRNLDAVVDYHTTARKVLTDICGAGRSSINIVDGRYGVVQDIPRTQVIQQFSPRNSRGFSGSKGFVEKPHALRVDFVNPAEAYQRDQLIVYNDGYSELGEVGAEWDFKDSLTTSPVYGNSSAWSTVNASSDANGHSLNFEQNASSPGLIGLVPLAQAAISIDGSLYQKVRLRVRRTQAPTQTQTWVGRFMWANTDSFTAGQWMLSYTERVVTFAEPDWSEGWSTITVDLSSESEWVGKTITHLGFEFSSGATGTGNPEFEIDWVRIDGDTQPATKFAELALWGVADAEQAWRDGRYHLQSQKLRPEVFTLTTDIEHLVCNRGDLVRVNHDVIGVGYGGARLTSVTNNGSNFVSATMDEEFYFDPSLKDTNYAMRLRTDDGGTLTVPLKNQGNYSNVAEAISPVPFTGVAPAVGDHLLFGEAEKESLLCLVQRISPRNDLTAQLELIEYNEAVYEPNATTPEHKTNISIQNQPSLLSPIKPEFVGGLTSDETALAFSRSGTPEVQIIFNVTTPQVSTDAEGNELAAGRSYAPTTHYHAQYRMKKNGRAATDWVNRPRVEATGDTRMVIRPVEEGETYDVRVRAISDVSATASKWAYANDHKVEGLSEKPPAPTALSVWGNAIRWEYGERPADFAGFVIRHQAGDDATWSTGISLSANIITDNWVQIDGRIPPGQTTLMVRAVDLGGNLSDVLSGVRNIRDNDKRFEIAQSVQDWNVNAFSNTVLGVSYNLLNDCSVVSVNGVNELHADVESSDLFYRGQDSATFWEDSSIPFWTDADGTPRTTYKEMSYITRYLIYDEDTSWPTKRYLPGKMLFSDLNIEGAEYAIEYRGQTTIGDPSVSAVSYHSDWLPWPGERNLNELEYPALSAINNDGSVTYSELLQLRVTIKGGTTRGKIKKARLLMEGTPKVKTDLMLTSHPSVPAFTGQYSLAGEGWRAIIGCVATLVSNSSPDQIAKSVQVHSMSVSTTDPYELSGPTFKAFDEDGTHTFAVISFTLEGY